MCANVQTDYITACIQCGTSLSLTLRCKRPKLLITTDINEHIDLIQHLWTIPFFYLQLF